MIVVDGRLRAELALCHQWGIPHSRFLSWPEIDQDMAIAYADYTASVCRGCGTRMAEWEPERGGDRHAYVATTVTCPGCQVQGDLTRQLREADVESAGRHVVLIPRREAERRHAERRARRALREGGDPCPT